MSAERRFKKMNKIITISRQFGSGGGEIGKRLAAELNIPFYDKSIINIAAKDSGFSEDILEYSEEMPINSLLYSIATGNGIGGIGLTGLPLGDKLFLAQFDAIKKIASEGPCVIIGRCSDYVLNDFDNVINVFIHADYENRVERIAQTHSLTKEEAGKKIDKVDKRRAAYYYHYTLEKWGSATRYDLCVNSATLGIDGTTETIKRFVDACK